MRRLLLITSLFSGITHLALAQNCQLGISTLKARVEANPNSVLRELDDAIALMNPDCLSQLIETAILAAKPGDETLTQIIRLAVAQYPSEAGDIAEAAVMASPERVDVIRHAFLPEPKPLVATPVFESDFTTQAPENPPSQIDLARAEAGILDNSIEFKTAQHDPEDVAEQAMLAIDDLLAKFNGPAKPASKVETFRMNLTDDRVAITTIDNAPHRDEIDETVAAPAEPLVIRDPDNASTPVNIGDKMKKESVATKVEESKTDEADFEFTSSVYHIPSSADLKSGNHALIAKPVIRSASASPTTPKGR